MRVIDRYYDTFKKRYIIFGFAALFFLITMFMWRHTFNSVESTIKTLLPFYFLISTSVVAVVLKKTDKLHIIYLAFVCVIGFAYFAAVPMGRVPDETIHFFRIYEISEGHFFTPIAQDGKIGNFIPNDFFFGYINYSQLSEHIGDVVDFSNRSFYEFPTAAIYAPVCYIPQALGIFVFRLFTDNAMAIYYGARLFNFISSVVIIFFSIKIIPFGKMIVFTVAMIPMLLHQMISCSADVLTFDLAIFVVSFGLYLTKEEVRLTKLKLIIFVAAISALALCKIVYIAFAPMLFIIPFKKFKCKKNAFLFAGTSLVAILIVNIVWFLFTTKYFVPIREGVDTMEQIKYVLTNPFQYVGILFNTIIENFQFYLESLSGRYLGLLNVEVDFWGYGIYIFILFAVVIIVGASEQICAKVKFVMFLVFVGTAALTFSALYAQWNPVAFGIIEGIQGRYFIPIIIPLAFFIPRFKIFAKENIGCYEKSKGYLIYFFILFSNYCTLMQIFKSNIF